MSGLHASGVSDGSTVAGLSLGQAPQCCTHAHVHPTGTTYQLLQRNHTHGDCQKTAACMGTAERWRHAWGLVACMGNVGD